MWEKAQAVSCQPCKHKDLILDSQHPLKANKQTDNDKSKTKWKKETKNKKPNRCWSLDP